MKKRSINDLIAEFAETQSHLCRSVINKYGLADDVSVVFSAPKTGSLELNGKRWTFKKHGGGVRFISDDTGQVVDAHRNVVSCPAGIDAWRLWQFLETTDTADLDIVGEVGGLENESKINELLSSLAAQGVVTPVEQCAGLYVRA